ncbi:MAG: hypothetical protein GC203_18825 [Phenylobacterium sp.]|nr:hypothetical protein [Phenylobacterium sp.]
MREPMPVLKTSLSIDAPADEVWRVLTTPELVREWACAYVEGVSIRTSWREGDPVTWKMPDGGTRAKGTVAAFRPGKTLKFVYTDAEGVAGEPRSFADTFELSPGPGGTRLELTVGPLDETAFEALKAPTEAAIREIKSLAEESAQIHGLRRAS